MNIKNDNAFLKAAARNKAIFQKEFRELLKKISAMRYRHQAQHAAAEKIRMLPSRSRRHVEKLRIRSDEWRF